MIIVDLCIIWFHLDYITQFQYCYHITTNVGSRKSATGTIFGDLPDWIVCSKAPHKHFFQDVIVRGDSGPYMRPNSKDLRINVD